MSGGKACQRGRETKTGTGHAPKSSLVVCDPSTESAAGRLVAAEVFLTSIGIVFFKISIILIAGIGAFG